MPTHPRTELLNHMTDTQKTANALTLDRMRADIAEMLHEDPAEIQDDDNLIDLGLDSIRAMALVTRWRAAGVQVDFMDLAERPELGHWWQVVMRNSRG